MDQGLLHHISIRQTWALLHQFNHTTMQQNVYLCAVHIFQNTRHKKAKAAMISRMITFRLYGLVQRCQRPTQTGDENRVKSCSLKGCYVSTIQCWPCCLRLLSYLVTPSTCHQHHLASFVPRKRIVGTAQRSSKPLHCAKF